MSAIHVVVRPCPSSAAAAPLAPLHGLFDVIVDGVNVTARVGEAQALTLLGELAHAVASLTTGRRDRATLQLYAADEAWELGLEADGADALVTVYRSGPSPEVAVFERRVRLAELRAAILNAIDDGPGDAPPRSVTRALAVARGVLATAEACPRAARAVAELAIAPRASRGFGFSARASFRQLGREARREAGDTGGLERADLHGLLVEGSLAVTARGRTASLGRAQLFLVAEQLVTLADEALDAWQGARPLFRRLEVGEARLAVRHGAGDGPLTVSIGGPALHARGEAVNFPEVAPATLAQAAVRFARAVADAFTAGDPGQGRNLRLAALTASAEALASRAEDAERDDSCENPDPESYRSFGLPRRATEVMGPWEHGGKMRFQPRWAATVPGIDLRATFLCGEMLVVGSARETASIHRATGVVAWRAPTARAACVVTPSGLARIHPDGRVMLHELDSGEVRFSVRVTPRAAGGASGAVVQAPGLPKLLVLAEGDRKITAIDLVSGDVRWRHALRRPGAYRVRRAGKLLLVAGGDTALSALDVATGEVVWRVRERLPFSGDTTVDHDGAFALAGTARGRARLLHLDPFSGKLRYSAELDERAAPGQAPLVTPEVVVVVTRDRRGAGAAAFSRKTGAPLWQHAPGLTAPTTAWLSVDDALIANSSAGTLVCIDANTGTLRYNHVFPRNVEADQPRRLEPVLRGGALFVPQHQVHVMRPRDGEVIGAVPSDLIPDLVRVDERCDVYVAEESGHLAAFGAGARLALVKG
ncbi:MAG: PQQ-binding-like beta-propeller repeat protein [Sorangiineae bacterium]|nr:PQQ-binding-like beta-propeller repeat protein [Polyangiaceae bacterium]MEB2324826.1 PQQ-binding-like beta-propeller repeat protein [Sorangiineae bacterium]